MPTEKPPASEMSIDTVFGLLASPRRRAVLHRLRSADGNELSIDAVAEALTENCETVQSKRRALISLRHHHLPKLDDTGVVEFRRDDETVRYAGGPFFDDVLQRAIRFERS
ncbi:DUF7344 domain-containing protein [Halomicrococcus sp. SG-WS-1]|uniref:DUF7344 domain-containing protein n=1 Tax=Halomicrococcus sp. SG-WS-1 TaxID=3439057 RepID=UPI003F7B052D